MKDNDSMQIVACCDKGFVMPTGVMVYSVCANNPDVDIDFHLVVDESVTDSDEEDLKETVSVFEGKEALVYRVDSNQISKYPLYNHKWITRATYYRLFLPEILSDSIKKVIYLDGDCIVRHSLLPLWNTDITEYAVAAVMDAFEGDIFKYNYMHYTSDLGYFNAGVLLVNLDYWRRHHVLDTLTEYLNKYPERLRMEDQDLLNIVLRNEKMSIHPRYNFQTEMMRLEPFFDYWKYEDDIKEAIADPVIIHYTTREKPWCAYARYPHAYQSSFIKYQNQTKWKGVKTDKRTLKVKMRNKISDYLRRMKILQPLEPYRIQVPPID